MTSIVKSMKEPPSALTLLYNTLSGEKSKRFYQENTRNLTFPNPMNPKQYTLEFPGALITTKSHCTRFSFLLPYIQLDIIFMYHKLSSILTIDFSL